MPYPARIREALARRAEARAAACERRRVRNARDRTHHAVPAAAAAADGDGRLGRRRGRLVQRALRPALAAARLTHTPSAAPAPDTAHPHAPHAAGMLPQLL